MENTESSVMVRESFYTVSGRIFSVLRCDKEKPEVDSYLVSEGERQWKIKADAVIGPGEREQELFKTLEKENSFLFELQALEHNVLPAVGSRLRIVSSVSL